MIPALVALIFGGVAALGLLTVAVSIYAAGRAGEAAFHLACKLTRPHGTHHMGRDS